MNANLLYNITQEKSLLNWLLSIVLSVTIFTVLERKIMGVVQLRHGPNFGLSVGLLQPLYDGVKLLSKASGNPSAYLFASFTAVHLAAYSVLDLYSSSHVFAILLVTLGIMDLYFIYNCMSSISYYTLLSLFRIIAMVVSADIILLTLFAMYTSIGGMTLYVLSIPAFIMMVYGFFMSRIPIEIQEAESELIAGFVTELTSNLFLLVSYIEVAKLLVICHYMSLYFMIPYMVWIFLAVLARVAYPRIRVDSLLELTYTSVYPVLVIFLYLLLTLVY